MLRPCACPLDPWTVARRLLASGADGVFLDGGAVPPPRCGWGGLSILGVGPAGLIEGRDWRRVGEFLRDRLRGHTDAAPPLAPDGALLGTVDYDGRFCFGVFDDLLVFDHAARQWWASGRADALPAEALARPDPALVSQPVSFRELTGRDDYERMVRRAREFIAAGDIYQVNLARQFEAAPVAPAAMLSHFAALRDVSPAPHAAFLRLGGREAASSSPELFLEINDAFIRTRPIKGTRPRGATPALDAALRAELEASAKERAELIMITDLERNDLGQVCEFGSVRATRMLEVETFEHVHHMVSTIEGRLRPDCPHAAALAACLPGGSISGAPKSRAVEIIAELEPHPRGLYTGALGCLGFNTRSQLSIVIRTLVREGGRLHFHAGAGIVADSDPAAEFDETTAKAAGLLAACR